MIISTAVSEVVVISQLNLLLFYQKILHFTVSDIKKNIRTTCLKLKECLNTKITIRLSLSQFIVDL